MSHFEITQTKKQITATPKIIVKMKALHFSPLLVALLCTTSLLIEAASHRQNLLDPLYAFDDIDAHTVSAGNANLQPDTNRNSVEPPKRNLNTRDFHRPLLLDSIDDLDKKPTGIEFASQNNNNTTSRTSTTTSVRPASSTVHYASSSSSTSPRSKQVVGSSIAASASNVDQVAKSFAGRLDEKPKHWSALENYYEKLRKAQAAPSQPTATDEAILQQLLGAMEPEYPAKPFRPPLPVYVGKSSAVRPNIANTQNYPSPFFFPIQVLERPQPQQQQQPPVAAQQASAEPSFGLQTPHERILSTSRRPWASPYAQAGPIGANPILFDSARFSGDAGAVKTAPGRMPADVQQMISVGDSWSPRNDSLPVQIPVVQSQVSIERIDDGDILRKMFANRPSIDSTSTSNNNDNNNVFSYGTTVPVVTFGLNRPLSQPARTYDRLALYRDFIENEKKRREHKQALLGAVYNQDQDYESALEEFYCLKNEVNLLLSPHAASMLRGSNVSSDQQHRIFSSSDLLARLNLNELARQTDVSSALMPAEYPSHMGVYNGTPPNFSDDNYLCAASWVHERFALTLASCLAQAAATNNSSLQGSNRLYVRSNEWAAKGGATNRTSSGQQRNLSEEQLARTQVVRQIKAAHIFPRYAGHNNSNLAGEHNLALLEFVEPIESVQLPDISPACQKHSRSSLRATSCWTPVRDVTFTEYFDPDGEGETKLKRQVQMKQVPVKLVANDENKCRELTGQDYYIYNHPNYICSNNIRQSQGKWRLVPLNQSDSFGSGIYCQENGRLSLVSLVHPVQFNNPSSNGYLDLSYYRPWIRSIIGGRSY